MDLFDKWLELAEFNKVSCSAGDDIAKQLKLPLDMANFLQKIHDSAYDSGFKSGLNQQLSTKNDPQ